MTPPDRLTLGDLFRTAAILALFLFVVFCLYGRGAPSPRPPLPAPDLTDQVDALGARLSWGRERVAYYQGAAHVDGVARLHFNHAPTIAVAERGGAEVERFSTAGLKASTSRSVSAPVAGRNLETTRNGRRGARFEAVVGSDTSFTVVSEPGAAEVSRRAPSLREQP